MSYFINNQQKLNDLIFENRNKNYGAYAIRSAYGNTMVKSLSCMILGFGTVVSIAYYVSRKPLDTTEIIGQIQEIIYTVPVDLKKESKPKEVAASKPTHSEPGKSNAASSNLLINDSLVVDTKTLVSDAKPGITAESKADPGPSDSGGTEDSKGLGKRGSTTISTDIKGNFEVDSLPEFEGGLSALYRFVASKLKYPDRALEDAVQGTVFVKFVVDEKGKVGNLSLLNNLGYGLDDEAQRVVAMIPNFKKPAKMNGQAVKVYYQLPIKFKYK
jgi:protein TonB